jgi:hypothetical protein
MAGVAHSGGSPAGTETPAANAVVRSDIDRPPSTVTEGRGPKDPDRDDSVGRAKARKPPLMRALEEGR